MKNLNQEQNTMIEHALNWQEKSVMVVDDLKVNYLLVKALLGKTGITVCWAESGRDAINILKAGLKIDVILMDYNMPGMDGLQTTLIIKKLFPQIPVVSQSTYTDSPMFDRSNAPFDNYLSKPLKSKELIETVQFYLNETKPEATGIE